jgi:hypothetical protein
VTINIMRRSDMLSSAPFCDITQRRTQEEDICHPHRGGSLKSHAVTDVTSGGQDGEVKRPI